MLLVHVLGTALTSSSTTQLPLPWNPPAAGPPCKDCPNIIFSLTDDQDIELGGWKPMKQTQALLQADGAELVEWRIHTPICSPSRSETVSGRYFHNIKSRAAVPPPKLMPAASGHINASLYEGTTFGVLLRKLKGYQTAIFGKANFNTYEGFDRWFQGAFLGYGGEWEDNESPSFRYKGKPTDYATALLGNKSIEWLERANVTGDQNQGRPFFLYFAPHCPHTPATPAKWYADECKGVGAPRTPAYNYTNDGFHELVAKQPPLSAADGILIDDLARIRCQCLMSVDDAHAGLVEAVKKAGKWNNTYWVVSSDHGYNLGSHRIPTNKFLLYDHALRIPMIVKGPGIPAGVKNAVLGSNVDYAPTWLAMAGIPTPACYDGRSILTQLIPFENEHMLPPPTRRHVAAERAAMKTGAVKPWRDAQFIQYYNQGGPSPWHPGPSCPQPDPMGSAFSPCEGWAPGSSSNPTQKPSDLHHAHFPRDSGLVATIRPLDDYSNTCVLLVHLEVVHSALAGR